jgi:hypothetical protein
MRFDDAFAVRGGGLRNASDGHWQTWPSGLHCVTIGTMAHRRPINGEDFRVFIEAFLSTTHGWAVTIRRAPRQSIERATFLVFLAERCDRLFSSGL